jgi:hypothetical protein
MKLRGLKKFVLLGLPMALISILLPISAISATKITPGTVCKVYLQKVTYQNKVYTCTKSGKKLLWNKGVAVAKPTPSPTPTPQPYVYPSDLTPTTLSAYEDFVRTYKARLTDEIPNIEFIVEPHMDKALEKQIVDTINVSAKFFAKERPLDIPLKIWIAMSSEFQWIYDNMTKALPSQQLEGGWLDAKLARAKSETGFVGGGAAGDDKNGVATLFFNTSVYSNWGDSFWSQVPAHEFTHVVQRYELANTMGPMLCWVREGNANFYGWMFAGRNSQAAYRNFWLQAIAHIRSETGYLDYESKSAAYWTDFFIKSEKLSTQQCDPWINYILGAMAFQYLAGTYGNQKIQDFYLGLRDSWKGFCNGPVDEGNFPCPSWKIAFKKVFEVTPDEVYPKFGQYIFDEIKWASGKSILYNLTALRIAPIPTS